MELNQALSLSMCLPAASQQLQATWSDYAVVHTQQQEEPLREGEREFASTLPAANCGERSSITAPLVI